MWLLDLNNNPNHPLYVLSDPVVISPKTLRLPIPFKPGDTDPWASRVPLISAKSQRVVQNFPRL